MSLPHASSGEIVNIQPLDEQRRDGISTAVLRTDKLEVMRLVLPAGKAFPPHRVDGESVIQCIEGEVELDAHGRKQPMRMGQMVYLAGGVEHALIAKTDASVLVTLLRNQN